MLPCKLLIIDDDETIKFSFKTFLSDDLFDLDFASNGKKGLEKLNSNAPDIIITDYKMPEMTGLEFIKAAKIIAPNTPIIIISAYGDESTKKSFLKEGAFQYIEKPFDIENILEILNLAKKFSKHKGTETLESNQIKTQHSFIGNSQAIKKIFNNIDKVCKTNVTVLIEGESGTGKDLIAQYIHKNSTCNDGPFISLNCAAIPENLIESELFGYEKGAFTGAESQKIGKFELANNGTIFLDEIGELNLHIQAKLLRILQQKAFERIGGSTIIQTNVRVIAATNKPLLNQLKKGDFREDLYYRLSSFPITVPPIRDRHGDIELIANYLFKNYCNDFNKTQKILSESAVQYLEEYNWPGNVRELQNILSRVVLLESDSIIDATHLEQYIQKSTQENDNPLKNIAHYSEKDLLKIHAHETFKICNFNKSETAKKLGINYRTLIKRLSD